MSLIHLNIKVWGACNWSLPSGLHRAASCFNIIQDIYLTACLLLSLDFFPTMMDSSCVFVGGFLSSLLHRLSLQELIEEASLNTFKLKTIWAVLCWLILTGSFLLFFFSRFFFYSISIAYYLFLPLRVFSSKKRLRHNVIGQLKLLL